MGKSSSAYGTYKENGFSKVVTSFVVASMLIATMIFIFSGKSIDTSNNQASTFVYEFKASSLSEPFLTEMEKGARYLRPKSYAINRDTNVIDWNAYKNESTPRDPSLEYVQSYHSKFDFGQQYRSWLPFANQHNSTAFEKVDCPDIPPTRAEYPKTYNILDITSNWMPDSTDIPRFHYDSLCHFDYMNPTERAKAAKYREAEQPFILYNFPEVDEVVKRWNDLNYLRTKLGPTTKHRTETSEDNHFMYWTGGKSNRKYPDWKPTTSVAKYTFDNWLKVAVKGQNETIDDREHLYFRATGGGADDRWIFDELPFFRPKKQLFIVEPNQQRGIHCRFGMRNVVAEAHFDGSRNAIALFGGLRRYILTHPNQCENMHMYPRGHPSARHSSVDWSKPVDLEKFPNFKKVQANEVVLQPGDVLYLPMYWIHYIVSLNVNFQCNTRSGITHEFDGDLRRCGF